MHPSRNNALGNFLDCFFLQKTASNKTVRSKDCGLSRVTRTLFLQRNVAVELFKCHF